MLEGNFKMNNLIMYIVIRNGMRIYRIENLENRKYIEIVLDNVFRTDLNKMLGQSIEEELIQICEPRLK